MRIFLAFLLAFVLIPGGLGAVGAVLVANYLPRRPKTILGVVVGVSILAAAVLGFRLLNTPGETLSRDWLDALFEPSDLQPASSAPEPLALARA